MLFRSPAHLQILHQETALDAARGRRPASTTRGFTDDIESFEFHEVPLGIMKKRTYRNGVVDEHPLIFPNILRQFNGTQIRVPVDDTHTMIFIVRFMPTEDGSTVEQGDPPVEHVKPYKNPPDELHPYARFRLNEVQAQDHMAWETQGPIADRTRERLATSDRGIVLLREMMKREILKVQQGLDPKGVVRDPAQNTLIDTHLTESIREMNFWREGRELPAALRVG